MDYEGGWEFNPGWEIQGGKQWQHKRGPDGEKKRKEKKPGNAEKEAKKTRRREITPKW